VDELISCCFWLGHGKEDEIVSLKLDKRDGESYVDSTRLALAVVLHCIDRLTEGLKTCDLPLALALHKTELALLTNVKKNLIQKLADALAYVPKKRKRAKIDKESIP